MMGNWLASWSMDMVALIFTGLVALLVYVVFYRWGLHRNTRGPKVWPLLGCGLEVGANRDNWYDWLVPYMERFPTISVPAFNIHFIISTDPANLEHMLKTNVQNYPKGEVQHTMFEELLGHGISNVDGDSWKRQRKTASYAFSSRMLRDFGTSVFRDGAVKLCGILDRASGDQSSQPVEMQDLFMRMTLDTICKVGFGAEIGSLQHSLPKVQFAESFDAASDIVARRFLVPIWKLEKLLRVGVEAALPQHIKVLDEFAHKVIKDRVCELQGAPAASDEEARSDLLSRFIIGGRDDVSQGSTKSLRDNMLTFVLAGRDTSAVSLSWFLHLVSSHPQVEEKILTEILELETQLNTDAASDDKQTRIQKFADAVTFEALSRMQYLHAAVTETLRLYPPVPMDAKVCQSDDILPDGTRIKKGQMLAYAGYGMARLERIWGSDASQFRPERWLKDGVFQPESPFKFVSFHAGPRSCMGRDSAYLQVKMTAAIVLRFFKFQLLPGHNVQYRISLVLAMKDGLRMTVCKRNT